MDAATPLQAKNNSKAKRSNFMKREIVQNFPSPSVAAVYEGVNESQASVFPSSQRRGGCASNKKLRSHRIGADGVVSSAKSLRFRRSDHPVRSFKGGYATFLLLSRPPLLCEEGNAPTSIHSHLHRPPTISRSYNIVVSHKPLQRGRPESGQNAYFNANCKILGPSRD